MVEVRQKNWDYDMIGVDICTGNETYEIGRASIPIKFNNLTSQWKLKCG